MALTLHLTEGAVASMGVESRQQIRTLDRTHQRRPEIAPGSTMVEVTLSPAAGDTIMTLRHTGLPVAIADEHRRGWEHFLPRLAGAADRRDGAS